MRWLKAEEEEIDNCILCGEEFVPGETGNELGFCEECQENPAFPYDLDAYYEDYDANKVVFKGFETMDRGILEPYRKKNVKAEEEPVNFGDLKIGEKFRNVEGKVYEKINDSVGVYYDPMTPRTEEQIVGSRRLFHTDTKVYRGE